MQILYYVDYQWIMKNGCSPSAGFSTGGEQLPCYLQNPYDAKKEVERLPFLGCPMGFFRFAQATLSITFASLKRLCRLLSLRSSDFVDYEPMGSHPI